MLNERSERTIKDRHVIKLHVNIPPHAQQRPRTSFLFKCKRCGKTARTNRMGCTCGYDEMAIIPIIYSTTKDKVWSRNFRDAIIKQVKCSNDNINNRLINELPFDCPLKVSIDFIFKKTATESKKRDKHMALWHTKRPDLDNLEKAIMDALSGVLWKDDKIITAKETRKLIAPMNNEPSIIISVEKLGPWPLINKPD